MFLMFLMFDVSEVEPVVFTTLQFSTSVEVRVGIVVGPLVSHQLSWKTALRILAKLGMNVQYDEEKKRTRPFFRENSGSLIIHENAFWAFYGVWDLRWTRNFA